LIFEIQQRVAAAYQLTSTRDSHHIARFCLSVVYEAEEQKQEIREARWFLAGLHTPALEVRAYFKHSSACRPQKGMSRSKTPPRSSRIPPNEDDSVLHLDRTLFPDEGPFPRFPCKLIPDFQGCFHVECENLNGRNDPSFRLPSRARRCSRLMIIFPGQNVGRNSDTAIDFNAQQS
jgi:hypothetical protein